MEFTEAKLGRIFVLRLHDGDRLPDAVERFAKENRVRSGVCFLVGGIKDKSCVVVGPKNDDELPPDPMVRLLCGAHEVCGVGTLFSNPDGKPTLHMHASFGRGETVTTGCTRRGIDVWLIGEVILLELAETSAKRVLDEKTGFELLEVKD
ncbi:MAG: DNA-binding protein [Candidatus Bathyarchaeota archaeon]|nr:DNA-binding protein [Candidatus Bathyarchaeota archaeon]